MGKNGDKLEPLLPGERRVLAEFIRVVEQQGRRPTYAEVAEATGYAGRESMLLVVRRLHRKGYIRRVTPKGRRTYAAEAFRIVRDPDGRRLLGFKAIIEDHE